MLLKRRFPQPDVSEPGSWVGTRADTGKPRVFELDQGLDLKAKVLMPATNGTRKLLGAPGIATSSKKLLVTRGRVGHPD